MLTLMCNNSVNSDACCMSSMLPYSSFTVSASQVDLKLNVWAILYILEKNKNFLYRKIVRM